MTHICTGVLSLDLAPPGQTEKTTPSSQQTQPSASQPTSSPVTHPPVVTQPPIGWTSWSGWSECDMQCSHFRYRYCLNADHSHCPGSNQETQTCPSPCRGKGHNAKSSSNSVITSASRLLCPFGREDTFWEMYRQLYGIMNYNTICRGCVVMYTICRGCVVMYTIIPGCVVMYTICRGCVVMYTICRGCVVMYTLCRGCVVMYPICRGCVVMYTICRGCVVMYKYIQAVCQCS